jgi:lambda repressor-like predicted transcriptional regulator
MAVTSQQIVDFLTSNPGMSDAEIVAAMEQYGVSPAQMAQAVGISEGEVASRVAATIPQGQSVTLGDTIVQPNYQVIGSGEDQQIGGLENVYTYKVGENKTGGGYNQYNADGTLARTGTQQKVDSV